jgi:hypothetical protein
MSGRAGLGKSINPEELSRIDRLRKEENGLPTPFPPPRARVSRPVRVAQSPATVSECREAHEASVRATAEGKARAHLTPLVAERPGRAPRPGYPSSTHPWPDSGRGVREGRKGDVVRRDNRPLRAPVSRLSRAPWRETTADWV